jgi:hypothetical protein
VSFAYLATGNFAVATGWLRHLIGALSRLVGPPARTQHLSPADVVEAVDEVPAVLELPVTCLQPVLTAGQPPPIPAEARVAVVAGPQLSDQERAWQELMNGRHPRLIIRAASRGASPSDSHPA